MKLLTAANRKALPALYIQDEKGEEAIAHVKFFCPFGKWTAFATEFDGEDRFFGLVCGQHTELGYFSLSELIETKVAGVPAVERDMYWKPKTLRECREEMRGVGVVA